MSISPENLQRLIGEDEFGLLRLPPKGRLLSADERLLARFGEIVEFAETYGRAPERNAADIHETQLAMRLEAIINSDPQRAALHDADTLGLLKPPEPPASLEEVLASDRAGLLDDPVAEQLLELQHVPSRAVTVPDQIAQRKPCPDFADFEPLLKQCHADLRSGRRKIIRFRREQQIAEGSYYILRGVLVYVASVGERFREHERVNARLRCIFENGTEADLLLRSFSSQLYRFGKRITEPLDEAPTILQLDADTPMATVYVLRSLSDNPLVTGVNDLHKIGSTKQEMSARIEMAHKHTTFLNAPVEVVAEYGVPRGSEKKIETMLHRLFQKVRMDIWFERQGQAIAEAREWFAVPLEMIDEALDLIENERITNVEYDEKEKRLKVRGLLATDP